MSSIRAVSRPLVITSLTDNAFFHAVLSSPVFLDVIPYSVTAAIFRTGSGLLHEFWKLITKVSELLFPSSGLEDRLRLFHHIVWYKTPWPLVRQANYTD
jgi:hypothetical protein